MRKLLDWLYPRYDKISIYLMTLTLVASIAADRIASAVVVVLFKSSYEANPVITTLVALAALSILCAGLLLPRAKYDLRTTTFLVVVLHTFIVIAANIAWMLSDTSSPRWPAVNALFVLYSLSWLVVLRYRRSSDLISDRQPHPREALYTGGVCIVAVLVAIRVLGIPWVYAYSLAFTVVTTLHGIGLSLFAGRAEPS